MAKHEYDEAIQIIAPRIDVVGDLTSKEGKAVAHQADVCLRRCDAGTGIYDGDIDALVDLITAAYEWGAKEREDMKT